MADNPITVPMPQDLPQNWTYGQTIGPQGTDVGLTKQHGYNYLMQQVNATQQAAQELGEAFSDLYGEGDIVPATDGGTGAGDTQNALNNLGAGVRPNLGDNCDFTNPINQKGITSWSAESGDLVIFDRWKIQGNAASTSAELKSDGLELTMSGANQGIKQVYPSGCLAPQKTYTSTVIVDGIIYSAEIVPEQVSGKVVQYPGAEFSCAITFNGEASQWYPYIDYRGTSRSATIRECKLEEGVGQTLAYKKQGQTIGKLPQPNTKENELLSLCQKYLCVLTGYAWIGFGIIDNTSSGKNGQFFIPLPTTMRTTPALSGAFRIFNGTENLQVSNANIDGYGENGVKGSFEISYSSSFSEGDVVSLWLNEGEQLILTAEL